MDITFTYTSDEEKDEILQAIKAYYRVKEGFDVEAILKAKLLSSLERDYVVGSVRSGAEARRVRILQDGGEVSKNDINLEVKGEVVEAKTARIDFRSRAKGLFKKV